VVISAVRDYIPSPRFFPNSERLEVELFDTRLMVVVFMLNIRPAGLKDVPTLFALIQEMADYEHLPCLMTEQVLTNDGFGERPKFRALMAEFDGEPAGYAFSSIRIRHFKVVVCS
jgi:hypothetical protein